MQFAVCVPASLCTCARMHAKCTCVYPMLVCAPAVTHIYEHVCVRACVRVGRVCVRAYLSGAASVSDRTAEVMLRLG